MSSHYPQSIKLCKDETKQNPAGTGLERFVAINITIFQWWSTLSNKPVMSGKHIIQSVLESQTSVLRHNRLELNARARGGNGGAGMVGVKGGRGR